MSPSGNPQDNPEIPPERQLPVPVPDRKLSLPAERLAGSARCLNCGTALQGPFCHFCGQPDKNLMRFFPALLRELLEDFMDFDSRFMRTLKPLLFRPGKLTRDYLDGRRFRYVPPLRLYIFSSLAFFFLAALLTSDAIQIGPDLDSDEPGVRVQLDDEERQELDAAIAELDRVDPKAAETITRRVDEAVAQPDQPAPSVADEIPEKPEFDLNGKPWDRETNPLEVPLMPDWVNRWINDEIADSPRKGRAVAENPDLFTDKIFDVLPATMFVLLPLVALLFKFWYLFSKKYYVEHLIFALHNHAFVFTLAVLMLLTGAFATWREPSGDGVLTTATAWLRTAAWIWIPLYLLLSLKRVYRQGWGMTLLKYSAIGTSYLVLLSFVTVVVAVLSFVLV
ncbi:MAG: DUF3667 domain-containing protein [Xanthomonadales bacterium]